MRLRPIELMSAGIAALMTDNDASREILERIARVRHQMWNGKWHAALNRMREVFREPSRIPDSLRPIDVGRVKRFRQHLLELRDYLRNNWSSLAHYAKARRDGLRISSAPAESSMSHVVNERMGKRRPMRRSAQGAHLLLQVRCAMLDERLESLFRE